MIPLRPVLALAGTLVTFPAVAATPAEPAAPAPAAPSVPGPPASPEPPHDEAEPPVVQSPDSLSGHLQLGVGAALALPFARLDNETAFRETADGGYGFSADVGIGVSRSVVVGGYFQYLRYSADEDCVGCEPKAFSVGAFARYHLVQGVRFDPWLSLGAGYRSFDVGDTKYTGIEWARLAIGGDWYPLSQIGFGPYLELDLGTFTERPEGTDAAVYATLVGGLRLAFDLQGR